MSLDVKFKTVGSFDADPPLDRQLEQFEGHVDAALRALARKALGRLTPTQKKTAAYTAMLGELVVAAGTFTVRLPVASPQNAGETVGIEVQSGTITVHSASGLVQGEEEDEIPAKGIFLYVSDGVGWWRAGGVTSITVGDGLTGGGTGAVDIGLDSTVITETALNAAVLSTRLEVEKLRILVGQLVKVEMGDRLDNGWEAACA